MQKHFFIVFTFFSLLCLVRDGFAQKINPEKLAAYIAENSAHHSEAIIIYQDNQLIAEKYYGVGSKRKRIEAMSATKSIIGLTVACMLTDKKIENLDIPICKFYPEWNQGQKKLITLRHLVNMTSGLQNNPNAGVEIYPSNDFVQLALCAELSDEPGTTFKYNNKSLNLLAGVIQKITGKRMDAYIAERLFKPLGIKNFTWTKDKAGNPHVMSGCQITPPDFVKIGLLVLNNGKYGQQTIVNENAMAELLNPASVFMGYGMLWWLDYENTTSVIDDSVITRLRKQGVDKNFIAKVELMKGSYKNGEYLTALKKVFGEQAVDTLNAYLIPYGAEMRRREFGGAIKYRADGYLGNYIIVDPKTKIVAIRMISYDSYKEPEDGFPDFKNIVKKIVD
ncbi:hypothetical protein DHW03_15220 [Pedobacter yonginense]|uniref:Beta-lactamase-related domain-containing protein n=1 Tax=Pedobacter yonginense TaxID=651869 RepID=A0A317EHT1_9SPHI|nr:serine hydrolase domain-containing protein [Pedobacter yonginense]PWS26144.1 hypothetical protein DHW03_15220 [Pedobacter yonginense]